MTGLGGHSPAKREFSDPLKSSSPNGCFDSADHRMSLVHLLGYTLTTNGRWVGSPTTSSTWKRPS